MVIDGAGIVTPEAVVLELQIAGLGSRLLAKLLDLLIVGLALLALGLGLNFLGLGATPSVVISLIAVFLLFFGYPAVSETWWRGKTVGKAALGIRVVTETGAPIRAGHALIRSIVGVVDFLLPPGGATAVVSVLVTEKSQRLGDLAAGTVVLRDRLAQSSVESVEFRLPIGWEDYARSLDVRRLSARQYNVVREFLVRAGDMDPTARRSVAWKLAGQVADVIGFDPDEWPDAHYFLNAVGWAWQERARAQAVPTTPGNVAPAPAEAEPSGSPSAPEPHGWTVATGGGGLQPADAGARAMTEPETDTHRVDPPLFEPPD